MRALKVTGVLVVCLVTVFAVGSCKLLGGEDDGGGGSGGGTGSAGGYVTYAGTTYPLSQLWLEDYGANSSPASGYDVDVWIGSSSLTQVGYWFSGTGEMVYLDLNTSAPSSLDTDTYAPGSPRAPGILSYAQLGLNYDFDAGAGTILTPIDATATVVRNGSEYTIEFELEMSTGLTAVGRFTGPVDGFF
jgi:hypothetical protein